MILAKTWTGYNSRLFWRVQGGGAARQTETIAICWPSNSTIGSLIALLEETLFLLQYHRHCLEAQINSGRMIKTFERARSDDIFGGRARCLA